MKNKIVKNFCYDGLGFPIDLAQVELIEIDGEWHPKLDVKLIANEAIEALAYQDGRLTGDQIKFIRHYFLMTLRAFGKDVAHETHAAVDKCEKYGEQVTSLNDNTECMIRLYILEQVHSKTKAQRDDFFSQYQKIKAFFNSPKKIPAHLHIQNYA